MRLAESTAENAHDIEMKNAWLAQQPNITVVLFNNK